MYNYDMIIYYSYSQGHKVASERKRLAELYIKASYLQNRDRQLQCVCVCVWGGGGGGGGGVFESQLNELQN